MLTVKRVLVGFWFLEVQIRRLNIVKKEERKVKRRFTCKSFEKKSIWICICESTWIIYNIIYHLSSNEHHLSVLGSGLIPKITHMPWEYTVFLFYDIYNREIVCALEDAFPFFWPCCIARIFTTYFLVFYVTRGCFQYELTYTN